MTWQYFMVAWLQVLIRQNALADQGTTLCRTGISHLKKTVFKSIQQDSK